MSHPYRQSARDRPCDADITCRIRGGQFYIAISPDEAEREGLPYGRHLGWSYFCLPHAVPLGYIAQAITHPQEEQS